MTWKAPKHLYPLLWLLLRRDFEIFRLCRTTVIHKDELWDSADTLLWIFDAVTDRHKDLEGRSETLFNVGIQLIPSCVIALFKQQKLDPGPQFKTFASEAVRHSSETITPCVDLMTRFG